MPKSIRVLTEIGKDKSVQVDLNQEFDHLQILSLQFTQSELYQRRCSDYGVVVGRVSVNNGYGLPNAKLSIFIPLTDEDAEDPIISELYPYRSLTSTNDAGYQYNLLPQTQSYSNHTPTGSFPTKEQIMKDPGWKKVFDKYYKFSVTTNQSGDFMIFGVPVGEHKLVMNIDLSDIGEFSLTPQDMIRMGLAVEAELDGVRFKSSPNFKVLPQIVTSIKDISVLPLWGDEDLCQSSINRTDFDLSADSGKNIVIQPTAIFMGSMISTLDKYALKRYKGNDQFCRVKLKMGELCKMTTGPGEILAIRHTIEQDSLGRPILEQFFLESNGKVIDGDGTWLIDVPMNLNYVITDQFGNQVPSLDASAGIPTTARYRFKIKWQQPDNFDQDVKRGYFLVPNVKEWGWTTTIDPNPNLSGGLPTAADLITKSYTFSLDWDDYGNSTAEGQQMIQDAILCDDRFYEFYYNKVYTVSQLVDQYRGGKLNRRYNSIKNILDEECESDTLRFPTNDAQWRPDFLYLLFSIFLRVITPVLIILLVVLHIIGFLLWFLAPILTIIMCIIFYIVYVICIIINSIRRLFGGSPPDCVSPGAQCSATKRGFDKMINDLRYFPLPNLTYPDCEMCNCTVEKAESNATSATVEAENLLSTYSFTQLSDWTSASFYDITTDTSSDFTRYSSRVNTASRDEIGYDRPLIINDLYESLPTLSSFPFALAGVLAGVSPVDTTGFTVTLDAFCPLYNAKDLKLLGWAFPRKYFSSHLTMAGRLNLFNTKSKYFNNEIGSLENPSQIGPVGFGDFSGVKQGPNQIKVSFNYTATTNTNKFHYDNVFLISCDDGSKAEFLPGRIVTFQDVNLSTDVNALSASTNNDEGIPCITGTTRSTNPITGQYGITNVNVKFASPLTSTNGSNVTSYDIVYNTGDTEYHRWPIDVEYFQVITAMTISEYESNCSIEYTTNNKCYPPERIFIGNTIPGWEYTMRNSLNNRFIFNNNLIRTFGNWNIQRPDFWVYQDFQNCYPIWGRYNSDGAARTYKTLSRNNINPNVLWEVQSPVEGSSLGRKQVLVFLVRGVDPYSTRNFNSYDLSILFGKGYGKGPIITGNYKLNIPIQEGSIIPRHNNITSNFGSGSLDPTTNRGIYYQNFSYQPSSDFSGFTSYMHRFYSCIDLTNHQTQFAFYGSSMSRVNSVGNDGFDATTTEPNTDLTFRINSPRHSLNSTRSNISNVWFGGDNAKYGIGVDNRLLAPKKNTFVGNLFCTTFDFHMGIATTNWSQSTPSNCPTYDSNNKGPNIDPSRYPQEIFNQSQQNCGNCGEPGNDNIWNGYPFIGRMAFTIGKFGVIGSEPSGPVPGGVRPDWTVEGSKWSPQCQMGFWVRHGGFEPDGYFMPRLNSNVGNTLGFTDKQTIIPKDYQNSKGYYPFESIEGGEVFAFRLKGSNKRLSNKTSPLPYGLGSSDYNLRWSNEDQSNRIITYNGWTLYYGYCNNGLIFNNDIDGTYYPTMRLFCGIYQLPNIPNPYNPGVTINNNTNVTMFNGIQFDSTTVGRTHTVMRTDRLPSSSRPFESRDYNNGDVTSLSYLLHNNPNFAIYTFDDDGVVLSGPPIVTGQNFPADTSVSGDTPPQFATIIETTNECNKMLPLRCYYNEEVQASGVDYYTILTDPNRPWRDGSCTSQDISGLGDRMIFDTDTGCYQLASRFILSLRVDIELLLEWKSRLDITFGACRNVFSHLFTNQWVNGVLYAYAFKNDKSIDRTNQVTGYRYCYDTLFLHPVTNSYFYRSSPWKYDVSAPNNGIFVGKDGDPNNDGGNKKYLNNPTTIMDLGPKTDFLQQIVQNDNFDGYIMKDLRDSTFGDTSDILNFFILSRLLNTNFFDQLFGTKGAGILGMFTRVPRQLLVQPPKQKNFIDADVAQMFSINSEIGVDEFEVSNYPFADAMYYNPGDNADETVIGVFFSSSQQVRDFLTPRRTIFNPNTTQAFWSTSFGYIPRTKTQYVPFYNWKLKPVNTGLGLDIFGSQQNDWSTNEITAYDYQSLDRLNVTQLSNYMSQIPSVAGVTSNLFRGFIFGYDPAVNLYDADLQNTNPYTLGDYQNNGNTIPKEVITHGAPFHFYFGLKKGKTALDRFLTKYTQDTDLI